MYDIGAVLGIDACPAGWAVCTLDFGGDVSFAVVEHTRDLAGLIAGCDSACVDIPIGIPDAAQRVCDARAKSTLGRYNARVFMTPPRSVFAQPDYPNANAESRRVLGKGLSKQAWNILPKVRAVDALLQEHHDLRGRVHECHPEIALWGLGSAVVAANKATREGRDARLGLLGRFVNAPERCLENARMSIPARHAKDDDLIDAMVCAVAAAGVWDDMLRPLDPAEPRDATGLAMNIWYRSP